MKRYIIGLLICLGLCGVTRAEVVGEDSREELMPLKRSECYPISGLITRNQPWFYWTPKMDKNNKFPEVNMRYAFRLSQDSTFKSENTTSVVLDRMFYSPHKLLTKGTWYWQYGWLDDDKVAWKEQYEFKVTGNESTFVTPEYSTWMKNIPKSHPRVLCFPNELGKLNIPSSAIVDFLRPIDLSTSEPTKSLIYTKKSVLDKKKVVLTPKQYKRFVGKRTKEIYKVALETFDKISKGYLLTGKKKYQDVALCHFRYLKKQYENIVASGYINDFTRGFYLNASATIFDIAYDRLSDDEKNEIIQLLKKEQEETFVHIKEKGHLNNLDSHLWQHHLRTFFTTSLTLYYHVPEAKEWVSYVYELWTMRAPVGSMSDGGWAPGNGYFDANKTSLIAMSVLFSRLTEVDYLEQPWFKNTAKYFYYTSPVGFISGSFGDNADVKRENCASFVASIAKLTNDPFAKHYLQNQRSLRKEEKERGIKKKVSRKKFNLKNQQELYWYCSLYPFKHNGKSKAKFKPARAAAFSDIGVVSMRSKTATSHSTLLTFRSSPFGATGHSHACQNAFNIQVDGEPLFFRTGYYSSFTDPHSMMSYRHTQAHNSILMDSKGQPMTPSSYGMMLRFGTSGAISYAKGDASNAYNGKAFRDLFLSKMKEYKITPEEVLGTSDAEMEQFDRHISLLGDNLILIYDELKADRPVSWKFLLQSRAELKYRDQCISTESASASGKAYIFSDHKINFSVTNEFASPAIDWLGNGAKRGIKYIPHWHASVATNKTKSAKFFTLISISQNGEPLTLKRGKDGSYKVGRWSVEVSLDQGETPKFIAKHPKKGMLVYGYDKVTYQGVKYNLIKSDTYIIDPEKEEKLIHMVDQYPDAYKYY
ncbi:DUF4962 domain-containing protein [Halosquirtibacter xylanolyticus]|uniref:DUF4962 domain-containing protein n=1 Tax=Halosquirtibacter xylanolyticus TaxID=3374599 RepID=UPI00374A7FA1|nr:DUF4962 domain-containing protein [Prolixibacteraceae bacterium]